MIRIEDKTLYNMVKYQLFATMALSDGVEPSPASGNFSI